jgi:Na+-translocating ferredoxin:NAD+ oxidoreductase RnfC subunit
MAITEQRLETTELPEFSVTLRNAGVAGAGGAGFPAYKKWEKLEGIDYLLVNHQESEPNYYMDKWLGTERTDELATFFDALLDRVFVVIVVGAKAVDRDEWLTNLEAATDGTVHMPDDLPIDPGAESGVVFAYTDDRYEYGMESVLLRMVADVVIGQDLPTDHGWIVQNTETLYNVYRALERDEPMTRKFVHVDGNTPTHRFLDVPIGTSANDLLEQAGRSVAELGDHETLADGGPGWCFEIDRHPSAFGVRKRTNCVLVLEDETVTENTLGDGRIQVLDSREWKGRTEEREPTARLSPTTVNVPLISNPAFEGVVTPSEPIVEEGDRVEAGEMIAAPAGGGISNTQHASIDGEVTDVTDTHVTIRRGGETGTTDGGPTLVDRTVYWTRCRECGDYVTHTETARKPDPTRYVCEDCR